MKCPVIFIPAEVRWVMIEGERPLFFEYHNVLVYKGGYPKMVGYVRYMYIASIDREMQSLGMRLGDASLMVDDVTGKAEKVWEKVKGAVGKQPEHCEPRDAFAIKGLFMELDKGAPVRDHGELLPPWHIDYSPRGQQLSAVKQLTVLDGMHSMYAWNKKHGVVNAQQLHRFK